MTAVALTTTTPSGTKRLGHRIGRMLRAGDVVLLSGELGAGKTVLAQGIGAGLGVTDPIKSSSFVIMNEYEGAELRMYHADLYRLEDPQQVAELALDELAQRGVLVVEWPERAPNELPLDHLEVRLSYEGAKSRRIELHPHGERYAAITGRVSPRAKPKGDDLVWRSPIPADIPAITALAEKCDVSYGTRESSLVDKLADAFGWDTSTGDFSRIALRNETIVGAGWASFSQTVLEERAHLCAFASPDDPELFEVIMKWLCENCAGARDAAVKPRAERVLALATADVPANQVAVYDALGFERFYVELEMLRNAQAVGSTTTIEIEIRRWTAQLHPQIRNVYNAAFAERDFEGYSEEQWPRAFAPEDVAARYTFVALDQRNITSVIFGEVTDDRIGWIDSIGVVPTHTGRGIATALIARAIGAFRAAGIENVGLRVNDDNTRARRLYEHLGFKPVRKHIVYRRDVPATPPTHEN